MKIEQTPEFAERWTEDRQSSRDAHEELLWPAVRRFVGGENQFTLPEQKRLLPEFAVLDVGCGEGSFLHSLAPNLPGTLSGIEINPNLAAQASSKTPTATIKVGDVSKDWEFGTSTFGTVTALNVVMHLNQSEFKHFLNECHRVLVPYGILMIAVVSHEWAAERYELTEVSEGTFMRKATSNSLGVDEYTRTDKSLIETTLENSFWNLGKSQVLVDDMPNLSDAQRVNLGKSLFDVFCLHSVPKLVAE